MEYILCPILCMNCYLFHKANQIVPQYTQVNILIQYFEWHYNNLFFQGGITIMGFILFIRQSGTLNMPIAIIVMIWFVLQIFMKVQCSVPPSIGSGSYLIQAGKLFIMSGTVAVSSTDLAASYSSSSAAGSKFYFVNLKYTMPTYTVMYGIKKLTWNFDDNINDQIQKASTYTGVTTPTRFPITMTATFGTSLYQFQATYLAIDSSLANDLFFHPSFMAVVAQAGAVQPETYSYYSRANVPFTGFITGQTKILLYSYYFQYNPTLGTANRNFGVKFEIQSWNGTGPLRTVRTPFGLDNFTRYDCKILYFNPTQLSLTYNIIVSSADTLSIGDNINNNNIATNSLIYTYTFAPGQGCDITSNNSYVGLAPYFAAHTQMNFQLEFTGNSLYASARNFYAYNFSVFHFCSLICQTLTFPFLHRIDTQCYDICPPGYYGNGTTTFCEACELNCSQCDTGPKHCTACVNGTFLNNYTCGLTCPNETLPDYSSNQCKGLSCTGTCENCQETGTNCTSCINNTFLHSFDCVYVCPVPYYGDSGTRKCEDCSIYCLNCSSLTECFSCENGSFLYDSVCGLTCPATTYGDVSVNQCLNCTGTCENCQETGTNCTSCINNTFLHSFDCVYVCPVPYYGDSGTRKCEDCSIYCLNCSSLTECFSCENGSFLYDSVCGLTCPATTYGDVSVNQCLNCTGTCENCQETGTNCTSCINNTFLHSFDCVYVCPVPYYGDSGMRKCEDCSIYCQNCSSLTECFSCENGSFLYDSVCGLTCPATTYGDVSVNQCLNCTGTCENCQETGTNCTSCINNTFLHSFDCVYVCPVPYYGDSGTRKCEDCSIYCLNCSSLTECFSCENGSFLYDFVCGLTCPATTYGDVSVNQCLNCTGTCLNCDIQSTNCTSCINDTFLYIFDCLYVCPTPYYGDTGTGNCQNCPIYCLNCSSLIECYSCENGSFLYDYTCGLTCPDTTYGDTSVNQCLNCTGTCINCDIQSTNCTSCINSTFFLSYNCYYDCPLGYYGNTSTNTCETCFTNCLACTAVNICLSCSSNTFMWPNSQKCSTSCPPNYFPNTTTDKCQRIFLWGCISALYLNNHTFCLQCNMSMNFKYSPSTKTCVCQNGYKSDNGLDNGQCNQLCGDGLVGQMECDDGNLLNGDGCNSQCLGEKFFVCNPVYNGPSLTSKCKYLPDINIKILSQIKVIGENTLKLILELNPVPQFLTAKDIKNFLNLKIDNDTINMSQIQITYKDGISQIYIPFDKDIEKSLLDLWTNFDITKYSSQNIQMTSVLQGDNCALLYSNNWVMYKNLGIFAYSMSIFVCILVLVSFYKHKMIGLQLILPFQVILYSQSFYNVKSIEGSLYSSFKPVSYSILTPDETESKANSLFKVGMTGGFLQNYNLLGFMFIVSTILFIFVLFKLQQGEFNRFKNKKSLRDWLKFGQFKKAIQQYETIIWKVYFVSLCLSTIPLLFGISSKAMTDTEIQEFKTAFDMINQKFNFLFILLMTGALFYTSVPRILYNNKKSLIKKHIFKQEGEKFKYEATYCLLFQLHYLGIGCIYAYCPSTLPVLYALSTINGVFFLYLLIIRPYNSVIDNVGALLSNFLVLYYLSLNLFIQISQTSTLALKLSQISGFVILCLLALECIIAIVRFWIFWAQDKLEHDLLKGLTRDENMDRFIYQKDKAFNNIIQGKSSCQEAQIRNKMKSFENAMLQKNYKPFEEQLITKKLAGNSNTNSPVKGNHQVKKDIGNANFITSQQQKQLALKKVRKDLRESLYNARARAKQDQQKESQPYQYHM